MTLGPGRRPLGASVVDVDLGPGVRAGFTTRGTGGSPDPWGGLNLGLGVGDDPDRVLAHRGGFGEAWGAPVVFATQVHGVHVLDVDAVDRDEAVRGGTVGEADALVTTRTDASIGVLVADCVPVLVADGAAGVVGVAHAGRRGLHEGVVPALIGAMVLRGARPEATRAIVGPCVCGACYEVPAGMRAEVSHRRPRTWAVTREGTPGLDLGAGALADLESAGIAVDRIEACTMEDHRYFSHRRAMSGEGTTGRFAGIIRLVPQT